MTFWTDPRLDILKAGLADGKSFAEIAAEIGAGCTRNAAIGKAQRIGIAPGRKAPPKWDREPAAERLAAAKDVVARRPQVRTARQSEGRAARRDVPVAVGDPRDLETFRYCGAPCEIERSYCDCHRRMAVATPTTRVMTEAQREAIRRGLARAKERGAFR